MTNWITFQQTVIKLYKQEAKQSFKVKEVQENCSTLIF